MFTKVFRFQKLVKRCQQKENPGNRKDIYSVLVKKNEYMVGHLPLGKTGNFVKTVLFKSRQMQHM